jgi:VIT1/CCC1 family predicted Fe2+/Mn2+ transporter
VTSTADSGGLTPDRHVEPHHGSVTNKLNWLRASVLGANDGIVSVAGIVVGVAAATAERGPVFTAGIAGLAAGALSMAVGEYVSVSTQRDTERAMLSIERQELKLQPEVELDELVGLYEKRGLTHETAQKVAEELTAFDSLAAHAEAELHIDPDELTNPWQAAISSAVSFTAGATLPLIAILVPPPSLRILVTVVAVLIALAITGWVSARLGGANPLRPTLRVTVGGALAMAITFGIGHLVGATVG